MYLVEVFFKISFNQLKKILYVFFMAFTRSTLCFIPQKFIFHKWAIQCHMIFISTFFIIVYYKYINNSLYYIYYVCLDVCFVFTLFFLIHYNLVKLTFVDESALI